MAQTFIRGGQILAGSITNAQIANGTITNAQVAFGAPVVSTDVITKQYLDAAIGNLNLKTAVRVASTADITGLIAGNTVDGVVVASGDRVLLKDQTVASENGIYVVGAGFSLRSTDTDTAEEIADMVVFVSEGTTNADSGFKLTTNAPIVIDTTSLTYAKFSSTISSSNFVKGETPSGSVNGINAVFTTASTPKVGSVDVYLNGLLQAETDDYSISGGTITFVSAPLTGDKVKVSYIV